MKKALSFIMAAAMAFGLTTAAFAETNVGDTNLGAVEPSSTVKLDLTSSAPSGGYSVWTPGGTVAPGSKTKFDFSLEAHGNKVTDAEGNESNVVLDRKYYDISVKVTGPLSYDRLRVTQDTVNSPNEIQGSFYAEADGLTLTSPKTGSITVIAKATSEGRRQGFETVEFTKMEYAIGYGDTNVDRLLAEIDDMHEYGETAMDFDLDSPVISKDMMEVLKKELNSQDVVRFHYGSITMAIKGSDAKKATASAFNIAYTNGEIANVAEAFADAEFDAEVSYLVFRSGAKLPVNATVTVDTEYATPYVYRFNGTDFDLMASTMDVDNGQVSFAVSALDKYVITDQPIPADLQVIPGEEPGEEPGDEPGDDPIIDEPGDDNNNHKPGSTQKPGSTNNPNTGSSSSVSMAVMLAVAAISAAGLIATKKSK